ncbi:TetR/AcrR family transcriptional regulator [Arthrobacter russicus]|nr:helix-turn-helix domain-containing protein [Arthrobacter russicus]
MPFSADQSLVESGTRSRTRTAIVEAAIELLPSNPFATLVEVAEAAQVGRTTLHRYFPMRAELLTAVTELALQRIDRAVEIAEPERGPFLPAVRRTVDALLEHGPIVMFIYSEPNLFPEAVRWEKITQQQGYLLGRLFAREESHFRAGLTAAWATKVFWSLLYSGWEMLEETTNSRQEVIESIMITFANGVLANVEQND